MRKGIVALFICLVSAEFAVAVQAPSVTTTDATNVTSTSATLNGTIDPHGASTTFYFEYGTTTSYGSFTQQGSTSIAQNIGYDLTGLTPGTTYHYRLVGSNAGGTTFGNDKMFTTSGGVQAPSVTTTDATNVTSTSATLNGTIDPHGASTDLLLRIWNDHFIWFVHATGFDQHRSEHRL